MQLYVFIWEFHDTSISPHHKLNSSLHLSPVILSVCNTTIHPVAQTRHLTVVLNSSLSTIPTSLNHPLLWILPPTYFSNPSTYLHLHSHYYPSSDPRLWTHWVWGTGGTFTWRCSLSNWTFRSRVWRKETLKCEEHRSRMGPLETRPLKGQPRRWFSLRKHCQGGKPYQDNVVMEGEEREVIKKGGSGRQHCIP